ncbi:MAG: PIN domain-containing protein [Acidimicrobiales bacterium]
MAGVTFDAGGLIAVERANRQVLVLLSRARETASPISIPATALAQAIRAPERQVRIARLLRQPTAQVIALGRADATAVGRLLAVSGTTDVVDAHVVVCARRHDQAVITTDGGDLRRLDPTLSIVDV